MSRALTQEQALAAVAAKERRAAVRLERCRCGRMPGFRAARVAQDMVSTWMQCPGCGASGASVEEAVRDDEGAAILWNDGKERRR